MCLVSNSRHASINWKVNRTVIQRLSSRASCTVFPKKETYASDLWVVMGLIPILLMIFNQFDTKVLNRKYRYASKCYVLGIDHRYQFFFNRYHINTIPNQNRFDTLRYYRYLFDTYEIIDTCLILYEIIVFHLIILWKENVQLCLNHKHTSAWGKDTAGIDILV